MKKKQSKPRSMQNNFTVVDVSPKLSVNEASKNNVKDKWGESTIKQKSQFIRFSNKKSSEVTSQDHVKFNEVPVIKQQNNITSTSSSTKHIGLKEFMKFNNPTKDKEPFVNKLSNDSLNVESNKAESTKKRKRSRSKSQKKENIDAKQLNNNGMDVDQDVSPKKRRRSRSKTSKKRNSPSILSGNTTVEKSKKHDENKSNSIKPLNGVNTNDDETETTKKRSRSRSKSRKKKRSLESTNQVPIPSPNEGLTLKQKKLLSKQRQKLRKTYNATDEELEIFSKKWVARFNKKNQRKSLSTGVPFTMENNLLNLGSVKVE